MEENKNLYVGFDLCNQSSQISCFHPKTGEMEAVGQIGEEDYHFIPTVLGVTRERKEWLFGKYAIMMANHGDGVLIDNIIEKIQNQNKFIIYDTPFEADIILEKFFRKTLVLLKKYHPNDRIFKLVITVEKMEEGLVRTIYKALENMGLKKEQITVLPHLQCYLYYALCQKEELWLGDVGMFDFGQTGLAFYQISINRKKSPMVVGMTSRNLSDVLDLEQLNSNLSKEKLAHLFFETAEGILYKQNISTLYFTGEGFYTDWADKKIKELCVGRRVFKGANIYTRGACYGAKMIHTHEFEEKFITMGEDNIAASIYIPMYQNGAVKDFVFAKAGSLWYEVNESVVFLFDQEEEIQVVIKRLLEKEETIRLINLEGMPIRKNKMGRYELNITFLDVKTCLLTIRDKGFGSFAPSTDRLWEKIIQI